MQPPRSDCPYIQTGSDPALVTCWQYFNREIEKFITRQPPMGEKDDYDSENSWISDGLPSTQWKDPGQDVKAPHVFSQHPEVRSTVRANQITTSEVRWKLNEP